MAARILACGRMIRDAVREQVGRQGLSEPGFFLLWACREAPPEGLSQTELAARLTVSPAQVSGQVERLRRQGLLQARRGEPDRRRQLWRLTPAGGNVLQAVVADLAGWAARLSDGPRSLDAATLVRLLDRLALTLRTSSPRQAMVDPSAADHGSPSGRVGRGREHTIGRGAA